MKSLLLCLTSQFYIQNTYYHNSTFKIFASLLHIVILHSKFLLLRLISTFYIQNTYYHNCTFKNLCFSAKYRKSTFKIFASLFNIAILHGKHLLRRLIQNSAVKFFYIQNLYLYYHDYIVHSKYLLLFLISKFYIQNQNCNSITLDIKLFKYLLFSRRNLTFCLFSP